MSFLKLFGKYSKSLIAGAIAAGAAAAIKNPAAAISNPFSLIIPGVVGGITAAFFHSQPPPAAPVEPKK